MPLLALTTRMCAMLDNDYFEPRHIVKGSMCSNCKDQYSTCSHLNFSDMPVLERAGNITVVKCTAFDRKAVDTG